MRFFVYFVLFLMCFRVVFHRVCSKVPLQGAASEGDLMTVSALLKAGAASCGERERDGQTPLHAAAEGGR